MDNYFAVKEFPAGYRFCPTDEELIVEYLRKRVMNLPLDPRHQLIREVNIYDYNPTELSEKFKLNDETEWYFFTPRFRKYPNGSKPQRNANGGHWKPTGGDGPVLDQNKNEVGYKMTLTFYEEVEGDKSQPKIKTDWLMHEYTLHRNNTPRPKGKKLDQCVLVKIYKKRGKDKTNQNAAIEIDSAISSSNAQPHDDQAHITPSTPFLSQVGEAQNQNQFLPPFPSPSSPIQPLYQLPLFPQQQQAPINFDPTEWNQLHESFYAIPPLISEEQQRQQQTTLSLVPTRLDQFNEFFHPNIPPFPKNRQQQQQTITNLTPTTCYPSHESFYHIQPFSEEPFFNDMGLYYPPKDPLCVDLGSQHNQINQPSGPPQAFWPNEATKIEPPNGHLNPADEKALQLQQVGECSNQKALGGCNSGELGLKNDPTTFNITVDEDYNSLMDLLLADELSFIHQPSNVLPPPH